MSWPKPASSAPSSAPLSADPGALDKSAPLWYTDIRKNQINKGSFGVLQTGTPLKNRGYMLAGILRELF